MAGHVDVDIEIRAPLDVVWRVSNEHERWAASRHRGMHASEDGLRLSFEVTTEPDAGGRRWTYNVERSLQPDRHLVFARRSGNPQFRYSFAWWLYTATADGTRIRSVQDFEMADGAEVDDATMAGIIESGTRAALQRMADRVLATTPQ